MSQWRQVLPSHSAAPRPLSKCPKSWHNFAPQRDMLLRNDGKQISSQRLPSQRLTKQIHQRAVMNLPLSLSLQVMLAIHDQSIDAPMCLPTYKKDALPHTDKVSQTKIQRPSHAGILLSSCLLYVIITCFSINNLFLQVHSFFVKCKCLS